MDFVHLEQSPIGRLWATCAKTAAPTWYAEAIWTLLLYWPTVARRGQLDGSQLDSALDERSFNVSYEDHGDCFFTSKYYSSLAFPLPRFIWKQ